MNILHIARRELKMYLTSPWTYIVLAAAVCLQGIFYAAQIYWFAEMCQRPADGFYGPMHFNLHSEIVTPYIDLFGVIFTMITPVLTMHLIAGERRQRSIELLLTSPISSWEIVLGKFAGALGLFGVLLVFLWYAPSFLYIWGDPDTSIMLTSGLGLVLLIACFISVGIAASSLSENLIVSAMLGVVTLLVFWVIEIGTVMTQTGWITATLEAMSLPGHMDNFTRGMLDSRDIIYMVSFCAFFLFVAQQRVESLRWR